MMTTLTNPARILLVDDDEAIQVMVKALLSRHHLLIDCVGDGEAALRELRQRKYDSVVLDLFLPKINGFEVIRDLKCRMPHMLRRVVIVTAASQHSLRDFSDQSLVHSLIRKPFDIQQFVKEVLSCVKAPTDV